MNNTATKSTALLKHHLKALKLPTMLAEAEKTPRGARLTTPTISRSSCNSWNWS